MSESKRTSTEPIGDESVSNGKSRRHNLQLPSQALAVEPSALGLVDTSRSEQSRTRAKQVHAFRVGSLGLILPENTISEIVDHVSICGIPNTSAVLCGVTSIRGTIVPVFHLQKLFGMEPIDPSYILVIGSGEQSVGLLLDSLPQQIDISSENRYNSIPPLPELIRSYARNAFHSEGLWIECDLFNFFKSLSSKVA